MLDVDVIVQVEKERVAVGVNAEKLAKNQRLDFQLARSQRPQRRLQHNVLFTLGRNNRNIR